MPQFPTFTFKINSPLKSTALAWNDLLRTSLQGSQARLQTEVADSGEPSLYNMAIVSSQGGFPVAGQSYDAWCMDPVAGTSWTDTMSGVAYSSAELGLLRARMPALASNGLFLDKLDSVNWLLNFYPPSDGEATFNVSEIPCAIWGLMGYNWSYYGTALKDVLAADDVAAAAGRRGREKKRFDATTNRSAAREATDAA